MTDLILLFFNLRRTPRLNSNSYIALELQKWKRNVQSIADRVAQHLEIIPKNFRFSTRRTRILYGIDHLLVLIVNPMDRILVRWKSFRNNFDILSAMGCTLELQEYKINVSIADFFSYF